MVADALGDEAYGISTGRDAAADDEEDHHGHAGALMV